MYPNARIEGIVSEAVRGETVVYDENRHKAHCLNRTAGLVWRQCDGQTSVAEIARRLGSELGHPVDDGLVWLALHRLEKAHLLQNALTPPEEPARYSRRDVARRLGLVGSLTVLLPLVTSIVAPTPLQAKSRDKEDKEEKEEKEKKDK
jgi:hypothetical protein